MSASTSAVADPLYLIPVIDNPSNFGTREELAQIMAFNDRLRARGQLHFAAGLTPPEQARVIDIRGVSPIVTPGPFHVATHHLSGSWIILAPDAAAAQALATEASQCCNRVVELRTFHRTRS